MKLSKLQEEIVNTNEPYVAVIAAAASGKTTVLTERVRKLLKDGITPSDMAVITFTNLAAQELRDRLADDYKDGIYIGTIHGLANYFLLSHGIETGKLIDKQEFDEFFVLLEKNPHCVKHIPYILLDEAQDTSWEEYDFIFNMINPDSFFIVGDFRQSIYGFKGCDPELFRNLIKKPYVVTYSLNENYRNGSNILYFAKKLLHKAHMDDDSIPMNNGGIVYENTPDIKNLKYWIKDRGDYKDWVVLCTTNSIIKDMMLELESSGIPCITFKQGGLNKAQLEELMQSNAVKVLTYHSSKGLEFPYVAAWEPKLWGGDESYRVMYVGATRAKDILLWLSSPPKRKKNKSKYFSE